MAPLTFKILRKRVFHLLLGPFGSERSHHVDEVGRTKIKILTIWCNDSDQSHHVDDFGAEKRNLVDVVANKTSC